MIWRAEDRHLPGTFQTRQVFAIVRRSFWRRLHKPVDRPVGLVSDDQI